MIRSAPLLLAVLFLLGFATVFMWHLYQQERFQTQLLSEGKPVTVQLQHADHHERVIWDYMNNVAYAGFTYQGRLYEIRCLSNPDQLSSGDTLSLLYDAPTDTFGQPQSVLRPIPERGVSRLIDWTSTRDVSPEWLALTAFIITALILLVLMTGLIGLLTSFTSPALLVRPMTTLFLGAAALFFTYDVWRYYKYVGQLKDQGRAMLVLATRVKRQHDHGPKLITIGRGQYEATFIVRGQPRRIAINADDYDRLATGTNRLGVLYDPTLDDFMAVNYSPDGSKLLVSLVLWLLFAGFLCTTIKLLLTT